jgi:hypothetical protein
LVLGVEPFKPDVVPRVGTGPKTENVVCCDLPMVIVLVAFINGVAAAGHVAEDQGRIIIFLEFREFMGITSTFPAAYHFLPVWLRKLEESDHFIRPTDTIGVTGVSSYQCFEIRAGNTYGKCDNGLRLRA